MTSIHITFESVRSPRQTFAERIGDADECTSALGHVTVGFSWLEQTLERHIAALAQLPEKIAPALTAELSYKNKVAVLSSLVRVLIGQRSFNAGQEDTKEMWHDLVKMLSTCEELRNQLIHSHWVLVRGDGKQIRRTKTTAKAARGIHIVSEDLTSDYILDVYDYILNVEALLDDFMINPSDTAKLESVS